MKNKDSNLEFSKDFNENETEIESEIEIQDDSEMQHESEIEDEIEIEDEVEIEQGNLDEDESRKSKYKS